MKKRNAFETLKKLSKKKEKRLRRKAIPQARRVKGIAKTDAAQLKISECAAKYAIAIVDPWDRFASGACVPHPPARPSMKAKAFARGVVTLSSTTGIGFIAISPSLCNDFAQIYYSTGTFAGTSITATNVATPGVAQAGITNLPFSRAQLCTLDANNLTDATGRIISVGLSLKYIGTELDRGGRIMCYTDPLHESINGYDTATMGARLEAEFSTPTGSRERCWIVANAIDNTELGYGESETNDTGSQATIKLAYPFSNGEPLTNVAADLSYGQVIMGALISGVKSNVYEWEVVIHAEYIGRLTQSRQTPNMVDPEGLSLVQTAIGRTRETKIANPMKSMRAIFKHEIQAASKEMGLTSLIRGGAMLLGAL